MHIEVVKTIHDHPDVGSRFYYYSALTKAIVKGGVAVVKAHFRIPFSVKELSAVSQHADGKIKTFLNNH